MGQVLHGQFSRAYVGLTDGTLVGLTELTQFATEMSYMLGSDMNDQTTFGLGGGPTAENNTQNAVTASVDLTLLFAPTANDIVNRIVGKPDGLVFMGYYGTNLAPTAGDEVFLLSGLVLTAPMTYTPGNTATWKLQITPVDGGVYIPKFYRY